MLAFVKGLTKVEVATIILQAEKFNAFFIGWMIYNNIFLKPKVN